MAFFPPSLVPNNRAYIDDLAYFSVHGVARFAAYQLECVIYWPWLSWNEVDVVVGPDQRAMPRCTLVGHPPTRLRSLVVDTIGATISFGIPLSDQQWEVIHHFDWHDVGINEKKFALCWCRPWLVPAPVPPVELVPGAAWASAPTIDFGVEYIVPIGPTSSPGYIVFPDGAWDVTFTQAREGSSATAATHVYDNVPLAPNDLGYIQNEQTGAFVIGASKGGLQFTTDAAAEGGKVRFRVTSNPQLRPITP